MVMFCIQNYSSFTGHGQKNSDTLRSMGDAYLKYILLVLNYIKHYETDMYYNTFSVEDSVCTV